MPKAKDKEKKGRRAKLSKVRKRGSQKKRNKAVTTRARKGVKKKAVRRKATSTPKVKHETPSPSPAVFTEIASEEVTLSPPTVEQSAMTGSTKPRQASESSFASVERSGNNNKSSI
ncbi:MAG: hypothetical protein M3258_00860 [Thermoproteota archaeon]|nr:hypothetical protein [Thermoproteota archaeon]